MISPKDPPPPHDRPILEACLEGASLGSDVVLHGQFLSDIPLVGTAFKICRAIDSVRDRILAAKILRFVQGTDNARDREKLRKKIHGDAQEARRIGELLVLVIDRVSDLDKPELVGQAFGVT